MLNIKPITADVIDDLESLDCLNFLSELHNDDRELFLMKSLLVTSEGDTLTSTTALPQKAIASLKNFLDESQGTIQGEFLIPFTLISGSMSYQVSHQVSWAASQSSFVQAPFFTFIAPSTHGYPGVQPDVFLKNGALSLLTDASTYFAIYARYPNFWQHILHGRNKLITILLNNYRIFASMNTDLRVAYYLHVLSYEEDMLQETVTLNISQNDIADALSISRGSVAKTLAKLYDRQIAESGYKTIAIHRKKLADYTNNYNNLPTENEFE